MNQDIIKGQWHEIKGKVKEQWGDLTEDELKQAQGGYENLQGVLQKKYGFKKEEAKKALDDFIERQDLSKKH